MKRYQIVLIAAFSLVGIVWVVGRITHAFQFYSMPTKANEPTFKINSTFFASGLTTPKRLDFICYEGTDPDTHKKAFFVHRVCGVAGDTIEIREGDLFVNGVNQDISLNLKKMYSLPSQLAATLDLEENEVIPLGNPDSVMAPLQTISQADIIKKSKKHITSPNDEFIKKSYDQSSWSSDNFGPYVVPANTYFVMGDNRDWSLDSRYLGPVEKKNVVATVLN